jgi:GTPase SAR1 family protein
LNRQYYIDADCCLLVYDVTRKETFEAIENYYINEINNNCKKNVQVCLVGNKTDLKEKREISSKEGADLATKYNFAFKETSCEFNSNVADAFETIITKTHTYMLKNGEYNKRKNSFKLGQGDSNNDEILETNDGNGTKNTDNKKGKIKKIKECC